MNLELFIAKRIHFSKKNGKAVSRPAVRVAILGIALGLAMMIITLAIVIGFKQEIRDKVIAFGSHIQITNFDSNETFETKPIHVSADLIDRISSVDGVRHVQQFATKPGIIKTADEVQGIILKGVDQDFDWDFYRKNMIAGDSINVHEDMPSRHVIISEYMSQLLKLKVDSSFFTYFVQEEAVRARKFIVAGIYCTNFVEYDKLFMLTDIRQIRQLNAWEENQASGLEILIDDYKHLEKTTEEVYFKTANRLTPDGSSLLTRNIEDINPHIFSWLDMLDMNVEIILILMLIVAGFNMISGLLILILERTNMIGILKAMGAKNWSIQKIFLYQSFILIGKGMFWGNLLGLGIITIQYFTHLFPLDPATYYISYVPIHINLFHILAINIATFLCSALMLLLPSFIIAKILPSQSIRFE